MNNKYSIINLDEYGISIDSIAGFLNYYLYTDRLSTLLYNVNGKKAMSVYVERTDFKPEYIPGGFSGICTNNIEQYNAPIKLVGEPREVVNYRGSWGYWRIKPATSGMYYPERCEQLIAEGYLVCQRDDGWGYLYELNKNGKPKMEFCKLGELAEHCAAFYDYNF